MLYTLIYMYYLHCWENGVLQQGQFKVVRENNGYVCSMYPPHIFTIFQNFQKIRRVTPLAGYHSIHQIWACAHLFGTLIYSICIISFYFLRQYLKQIFFQNTKLFYIFWKNVNNKHTLFELVSSWSVHQHPPRERLHSGRETWLSTMERTSALSKMQS